MAGFPVLAKHGDFLCYRSQSRSSGGESCSLASFSGPDRSGARAVPDVGRQPRTTRTASRCSCTWRSIGFTQPVSVLRHPQDLVRRGGLRQSLLLHRLAPWLNAAFADHAEHEYMAYVWPAWPPPQCSAEQRS